jgi:hypothetical protein
MITSAVYAAALLVVPESVVSHVLGQTWLEFRPVLVPAIVAVVLAGGSMGPFVALRAHGYARASLGAKVVRGIAGLLLPLLGVQVIGLSGYFWGSAAASALGAVWSLGTLRRAERHAPVEPVGTPG